METNTALENLKVEESKNPKSIPKIELIKIPKVLPKQFKK